MYHLIPYKQFKCCIALYIGKKKSLGVIQEEFLLN